MQNIIIGMPATIADIYDIKQNIPYSWFKLWDRFSSMDTDSEMCMFFPSKLEIIKKR